MSSTNLATLCLKLIWLLFSESGSLWVAWHHHHHIKGKSFWSIKAVASDSWNWKSLLHLRSLAESFVKCELGNGVRASFWFDSWSILGLLISLTGEDGPSRLNVPLHSLVADACARNVWLLPEPRSPQEINLYALLHSLPPLIPDAPIDRYFWVIQEEKFHSFPTAKTWDLVRSRASLKNWASSIWFKGATPKHAFIMWLAQLGRLPTRDRLASWGIATPLTCCICSTSDESHEHLLLRCPFSEQLWIRVQSHFHLNPYRFYTWSSLLTWTRMKSDTAPAILRKLATQAEVYHIWKLRNNILHNHVHSTPEAIFKDIEKELRNTYHCQKQPEAIQEHDGTLDSIIVCLVS